MVDINSLYTEEEKKDIEDFNDKVSDAESILADLYQEIIELRREGRDCLVAEFNYRNIRSKIPYIRTSLNERELNSFKVLIESLKKEIADIREQKIINVKKEVEQRLNEEGVDYIGRVKED